MPFSPVEGSSRFWKSRNWQRSRFVILLTGMETPTPHIGSRDASFGDARDKQAPYFASEMAVQDHAAHGDDGLQDGLDAGVTANDRRDMQRMGKTQQFRVSSIASGGL